MSQDRQEYNRLWYLRNRERKLGLGKLWVAANPDKIKVIQQRYRDSNPDKISDKNRRFRDKNPEYMNEYQKDRCVNDPNFRIIKNLRIRLSKAIRRGQKVGSAVSDLGCTIEEFRSYLESKFYGVMTWDNYGSYWEIDHVKPLSSFDLSDPDQFFLAVHYTNHQPLTKVDNRRKGASLKWSRTK